MVVDSGCVVLEKWCVEGGIQPHHETREGVRRRVCWGNYVMRGWHPTRNEGGCCGK